MSSLDRAAKFGAIGASGVLLYSLGMAWVTWSFWISELSDSEMNALGIIVIFGIIGAVITVVFLFVIVGQFIHRELEARGLSDSDQ